MKDNSNYEIIENDAELKKLCTASIVIQDSIPAILDKCKS